MSAFVECDYGIAPETVLDPADRVNVRGLKLCRGHDLRGKDINLFFERAKERGLSDHEQEFFEEFIKPITQRHAFDFAVIAFSVQTVGDPVPVVSHELLHAQFFREAAVRELVLGVHANLPSATKEALTASLKELMYSDVGNLHANEMFAYHMQKDAPSTSKFAKHNFFSTCREVLLEAFRQSGLRPLNLE